MTVQTITRDGVPVVTVAGEVDMSTAGPFLAEMTTQLSLAPAGLVVDLRAVSFFGSAGVGALLAARDCPVRVVVVTARPIVLRMLEITNLDRLFDVRRTLPEALRALRGQPT
ncbi:hypothetical protein Lesp02_39370 [Lentzea sp. NBRC 105346]|uniref:STAS domain-containing protein n=1 Tax=Lentzea sp. NBRC 105346 TaxID=3032205 RepID=UPI0024A1C21C|nr:STAS domain-containing protein [Lentzea sp. NBRC 105346]GLZ31749.1 hypothetical protein Lesp02_39370 [Lentzea sp. NBRC 105346]